MYMIYHGDEEEMSFGEPRFYDTVTEAIAYANSKAKEGIPKGHALSLFRCKFMQVLHDEPEAAQDKSELPTIDDVRGILKPPEGKEHV